MHDFEAIEPGVPQCAHCGLPPTNGRHPQDTTAPPARVEPIKALPADDQRAIAAFREMWGGNTPKAQVFCELAVCQDGGATDDELYAKPHLSHLGPNTIRPRRLDLANDGLIQRVKDEQGRVVTRQTANGGQGAVWVLTPLALRLLAAEARNAGLAVA